MAVWRFESFLHAVSGKIAKFSMVGSLKNSSW